jgi:thiamine kinase-like enzyme
MVEAETLAQLRGTDLAPDLVQIIRITGAVALVYHHLDGTGWSDTVEPVALLLQRLHKVAPFPLRVKAKNPLDLLRQGEGMLSQLKHSESDHLRCVRPRPPTCVFEQVLLHGDPVPSNFVQKENNLRLIDWQCPAIGDPTEDIAIFLSPAMQHLFGGRVLTPADVDTFLKAYGDPARIARYLALAPLYHWRMAAYCLWKVQHGDPEYNAGYALELKRL